MSNAIIIYGLPAEIVFAIIGAALIFGYLLLILVLFLSDSIIKFVKK